VPVQVAVAMQQDMPRRIDSIGAVQALRSVAIKSQVDGIIAQIHFREGDDVAAGDLLVTLDRRPLRTACASQSRPRQRPGRGTRAQADADRYTQLNQQDAISKEQYAQLTTKAETTRALAQAKEAAVANAELQLGYSQIRAPIAGRTGQLLLHEGALVKANDNSFSSSPLTSSRRSRSPIPCRSVRSTKSARPSPRAPRPSPRRPRQRHPARERQARVH